MGLCQSIDRTQLFNLLTGVAGIYIIYFIAGLLHESLIKRPQYNRFTNNYDICDNASGLLLVPFLAAWALGALYNCIFLEERVSIPAKNLAMTSGAVVAASYFSLLAIQRTSFPVVIMFESCSVLPVIFIAVFCSRVHDPNLKLGPKKIVIALIITAGILLFQFSDPETKEREVKEEFIGILFLVFHFVAQGFLPDFQAEIKAIYKPGPTEMMAEINKWASLFTLVVLVATMQAWSFVVFLWEHMEFSIDLAIMSVASGFGQFFVYRMIKQFKQHFVPFTISSRKILTVAISIVFYKHKTNWVQIVGICIVLFTVFVEFITEISGKKEEPENRNDSQVLNEERNDQIKSSDGNAYPNMAQLRSVHSQSERDNTATKEQQQEDQGGTLAQDQQAQYPYLQLNEEKKQEKQGAAMKQSGAELEGAEPSSQVAN